MSEASRRQLRQLALAVVVLVAVLWWQFGRGTAAPSTAPAVRTPVTSNRTARPSAAPPPVVDVKIAALQQGSHALAPAERNPFRFREKPPPPAPPRSALPPSPPVEARAPSGPPPPPPITLRLMGMLGETAVLRDNAGNPIYGKEGDIIEGRYRVLRVAADSVDVAYLDGRGRQTLRLTTP